MINQDMKDKKPAGKDEFQIRPPAVNLPKGGGAIRGIGEKFAANPVTGTGSMTVPIATSPGRSGFAPQLSLSYDSGSGNGPFGFGWSLSLPQITRKTDKGLPQYFDAEESDVFILSGAEDLVPVLDDAGKPLAVPDRTVVDGGVNKTYAIKRYRPRIEGLFARIERWTNQKEPTDIRWRSISKDNITTWYGKTENSRVFDPNDKGRIFSWLICESYDDKGNAIVYEYQSEDSKRIFEDQHGQSIALAHERNRSDTSRSANRYLKRIKYGNRTPNRKAATWEATDPAQLPKDTWMFEVVFDYGEGHYSEQKAPDPSQHDYAFAQIEPPANSAWPVRQDPFSTYKAGFEIRTYRLCHRVLMFHHFPDELGGIPDYLVRSTEFTYEQSPLASFITSVTQSGYKYDKDKKKYLKKSLPPLEFEYSKAVINEDIQEVDAESLENLPNGLDGTRYQWVDLDGEGISGILTEQADTWFYKPNTGEGTFGPLERVSYKPSLAALSSGQQQLLDLAGDGQLDLVEFGGPVPGFYERTEDRNWEQFKPFSSLPNLSWNDPNLKFVDLDGDGHADILITEGDEITWYPSLAEQGFGPRRRVSTPLDEEKGPRLVFADGTQSIYLADLSGDSLSDLVRIRNGEVCYWPNLGYGRFGAKVTMDNAPRFDSPDQFDQKRIRLADIDGSGTTDILYLNHDRVAIYRNECGNGWSDPEYLNSFPPIDDLSTVIAADLLGNGTACVVWSSPLPYDMHAPMKYIDLMKEGKPHLLRKTTNNLGAETRIYYSPSTKFYLKDKHDGQPWITKLPFPVHVVEQVITYDYISRNRFVTCYAYHHGYFDGVEREFRGFGMVEQWDTEQFATLSDSNMFPVGDNVGPVSYVPPVLTKTWFHTGVYDETEEVSRDFAAEYYGAPEKSDPNYQAKFDVFVETLLPDTVLPSDLPIEEEREACRALKGMMLRQEVYADDAPAGSTEEIILRAKRPYTVLEQNFTIERLQPRKDHPHAVFFTHSHEVITYHYERGPADPRISHALTLKLDEYGNVLRSLAVCYPRANVQELLPEQAETHVTLILARFANRGEDPDWYRLGLPVETRTYEVAKPPTAAQRFGWEELNKLVTALIPLNQHEPAPANTIPYEQWDWRKQWNPQIEPGGLVNDVPVHTRLRLIEQVQTLYRKNDLTKLLLLGEVESLALPGETYTLAFTPGLLAQVFKRKRAGQPDEALLPANPAPLLGGKGTAEGGYVGIDGDWWIPSGWVFFHPDADIANPANTAAQEQTTARQHFYLPRKFADPFDHCTFVDYDEHDILVAHTTDALDNKVIAENDYRVLQPRLVTDPNRNRTAVAFDALGLVVATAVMGKEGENLGDLLEGFDPDPPLADLQTFVADPRARAASLLGKATTRIVYDLERYSRADQPPFAGTLARETHFYDAGGDQTKIQISFSYSDGFGREIQKKIQAESGEAPQRNDPVMEKGDIRPGDLKRDGQGKIVEAETMPRWVSSGRTVFNNKGKPVRKYEPFFSAMHLYEPEPEMTDTGVSPVLFYDPIERVVATLHPNHTYEKVVFDPWQQTTYDVNDTIAASGIQTGDPRTDPDVAAYVREYFKTQPANWKTWHAERIGNQMGAAERDAAKKAAAHADTPTVAHLDSLGRTFLTLTDNGPDPAHVGQHLCYPTRIELDIEGNQRAVIDAKGRVVMRYDYHIAGPEEGKEDEAGHRIHQNSMDAGERWMLYDVTGNLIRTWDNRGFIRRMTYDELRRPTGLYVTENQIERLAEHTVYGEGQGNAGNHRTRVYQTYDGAGRITSESYDFKGNLLQTKRELLPDYKHEVNWNQNPQPNNGTFISSTTYDALNRPFTVTSPDGSVYRPTFNEANLLDKVEVNLRGAAVPTPFVTNIDYNAKGQRERIEYGCGAAPNHKGVTTIYEYDRDTFRLTRLKTTRPAGLNGLASQIFADSTVVQDLRYTYDPAGNITRIEDAALRIIFNNGEQIDPVCSYTYDAMNRLIEAKGREHIGQAGFDLNPLKGNCRDYPFAGLANFIAHPNDLQKLSNYTESYEYDAIGNFEVMRHTANSGSWTRRYDYEEDSLIEPGIKSNRLSRTRLGNGLNHTETYTYSDGQGHDVHGCMTAINNMNMVWDFEDQLLSMDLGGAGKAYYIYDVGGQRVRKVIESQNGSPQKERIYLGGFEIYREYNGNGVSLKLERESLHVMDDKQRIALVETKTIENSNAVQNPSVQRYQLGNHLGSASLELDKDGALISYEEYHPYGTTAFQAGRSAAEVGLKRYRYTGMERDEESGLYYHGARYYAAWLGRWTSSDPLFLLGTIWDQTSSRTEDQIELPSPFNRIQRTSQISRHGTKMDVLTSSDMKYLWDEMNLYMYGRCNPIIYSDPTGLQVFVRRARGGGVTPAEQQTFVNLLRQDIQALIGVPTVYNPASGVIQINAANVAAARNRVTAISAAAAGAGRCGAGAGEPARCRNEATQILTELIQTLLPAGTPHARQLEIALTHVNVATDAAGNPFPNFTGTRAEFGYAYGRRRNIADRTTRVAMDPRDFSPFTQYHPTAGSARGQQFLLNPNVHRVMGPLFLMLHEREHNVRGAAARDPAANWNTTVGSVEVRPNFLRRALGLPQRRSYRYWGVGSGRARTRFEEGRVVHPHPLRRW